MAGTPFMEVSALAYTRATAALVCGTILVTYGIYLVKGGDPFLPTISNTWDTHPGTWVSRWVVGNACDMFAVVQVMLYATSTDTVGWRRVSLCLGVAGVFCLSWVGSICDSPNPDCKGNDAIHSTLAVTFFVLYDVKMILVSCRERCRTGAALGAAAAALTALRVAAPLAAGVGRTHLWALAAFEWGNVALMCAWTLRQVRRTCGGLSWVVGNVSDCAYSLDGATATALCGVFYIGTLALTAAIGLARGSLPVEKGVLFFISDMWPTIPGNWISRWAVVQGAHCGAIAHVALYCATPPAATLRRTGLIIALVALLGLSVVGCVDEKENFPLHVFGALNWFLGYDLFIALTLLGDRLQPAAPPSAWRPVRDAVGVAAIAFGWYRAYDLYGGVDRPPAAACDGSEGAPSPLCSLAPLVEWTDALVIIAFLLLDGKAHPAVADCHEGVLRRAKKKADSKAALAAPLLA